MSRTCLHLCSSEAWGGLELYAGTVMTELKSAGWKVSCVCRPGSKLEKFLRAQQIETVILPSSRLLSPAAVRSLRSIIRANDIGVMHVHFHRDIWNASLAARGVPDCKLFLSIYMGVPRKNDPLHRFIYRRVDHVFTSSEDLNRRLPQLYPIPAEKIGLLPYGRDLSRYAKNADRRSRIRSGLGVAQDEILAGTMVRIDPGKGVMDFVCSFPYLPDAVRPKVRYLIVGEPTRKSRSRPGHSPFEEQSEAYLREIERFVERENLSGKVLFAGFQHDLIGYLEAMDLFVFPSRDELYSLVVLDAMGMGLPVVASRAGGDL